MGCKLSERPKSASRIRSSGDTLFAPFTHYYHSMFLSWIYQDTSTNNLWIIANSELIYIFHLLSGLINFNKKFFGPIFNDEHRRFRIMVFIGLRLKIYCIADEVGTIHSAIEGAYWNGEINIIQINVRNNQIDWWYEYMCTYSIQKFIFTIINAHHSTQILVFLFTVESYNRSIALLIDFE